MLHQQLHLMDLKKLYLPKLATGEWSGTMNLTEPQCGTDLGLCRTMARPQKDGSYMISGTKIFITGGEHDALLDSLDLADPPRLLAQLVLGHRKELPHLHGSGLVIETKTDDVHLVTRRRRQAGKARRGRSHWPRGAGA